MTKLTEDERGALHWYGKEANQVGQKALKIIDEQAAEIRELENKGYKAAALLIDANTAAHAAEAGECRAWAEVSRVQQVALRAETELSTLSERIGSGLRALTNLNASDATRVVDALEALRG